VYMNRKNDNYKIIMIAFAIIAGLMGGSSFFFFFHDDHSADERKLNCANNNELDLTYHRFYALWTVTSVIIIIFCNSFIMYSIKFRVRSRSLLFLVT
jgi:C4-dicarboxylate transporter